MRKRVQIGKSSNGYEIADLDAEYRDSSLGFSGCNYTGVPKELLPHFVDLVHGEHRRAWFNIIFSKRRETDLIIERDEWDYKIKYKGREIIAGCIEGFESVVGSLLKEGESRFVDQIWVE